MKTINKHGLKMHGLKAASGETSYIQAATPAALAAAYRDAAAYFLDLAGQLSGQPAGLVPQIAAMQAEHKSIFCGEAIV